MLELMFRLFNTRISLDYGISGLNPSTYWVITLMGLECVSLSQIDIVYKTLPDFFTSREDRNLEDFRSVFCDSLLNDYFSNT